MKPAKPVVNNSFILLNWNNMIEMQLILDVECLRIKKCNFKSVTTAKDIVRGACSLETIIHIPIIRAFGWSGALAQMLH